MVAWSRLVADESAITTGATSATHLHCVYVATVEWSLEMDDVVTRVVACQHFKDSKSKSKPIRRAESAHPHRQKSTFRLASYWRMHLA
jgi:hypothetical protein